MGQLTRNEVFTLAVQRYSDTVYRTAVHNCRCTADAEDVVQDVFEKLLHYNGILENEEHLKEWLLRIAINAIRTLPENYRNAIYLHYYEGYTAAEIGRMMAVPTNTVLSWLRRARAQLHTMLKEEIEDEVV